MGRKLDANLKEGDEMIPVLGVPVLGNHERLMKALKSVDAEVEHLVIVDQSGTDWRPEKPVWAKNMHVFNFPFPMGVAASWNLMIKATPHAPYWVFINDDIEFNPGVLAHLGAVADGNRSAIVMTESARFSAFAIGEGVVLTAGLFDENCHPMYYEDTEYLNRLWHFGLPLIEIQGRIAHDESSTIHKDGWQPKNLITFPRIGAYYEDKKARGDYTPGHYNLQTRRDNAWENL